MYLFEYQKYEKIRFYTSISIKWVLKNTLWIELIYIIPIQHFYLLQKKLFDLPVKMDWANEKAFNAVQYPFFFQKFLRIFFFDIEVRFFGTAIQLG